MEYTHDYYKEKIKGLKQCGDSFIIECTAKEATKICPNIRVAHNTLKRRGECLNVKLQIGYRESLKGVLVNWFVERKIKS